MSRGQDRRQDSDFQAGVWKKALYILRKKKKSYLDEHVLPLEKTVGLWLGYSKDGVSRDDDMKTL